MSRGPSLWQVTRHPFTAIIYGMVVLAGLVLFGLLVAAVGAVYLTGLGAFRLYTWARRRVHTPR